MSTNMPSLLLALPGILPITAAFLLFVGLYWKRGGSKAENVIIAMILWGVYIFITTEILSLLRWITFSALVFLWSLTNFGLLIWVASFRKTFRKLTLLIGWKNPYLPIVVVAIILLIIGFICPPNNWDSMSCHMSRVAHWIQDRSIKFYPTNILTQLYEGVWASFAILHFQVLSTSDYFANSIQWVALSGCLIVVLSLTNLLGGNQKANQLSVFFTLSVPMGILQATSTQTDYVVSFWIITSIFFLLKAKTDPTNESILLSGLSIGLGLLTKPTTLIFVFPFIVLFGIEILRKKIKYGIMCLLIGLITIVGVNICQFTRNTILLGGPLSSGEFSYTNEPVSIKALFSNVLKNSALQIGSVEPLNTIFTYGITAIHEWSSINIDDITTSTTPFYIPPINMSEDLATYTGQLVLLSLSFPVAFFSLNNRQIRFYAISVVGAYLLFCLILKYQAWNNRLLLPLYIISAPVFGIVISKYVRRKFIDIVMVVLIISTIPYVFRNQRKPILSSSSILSYTRKEMYFLYRPELMDNYLAYARYISETHCKNIGVQLVGNDWEYPLWKYIDYEGITNFRIEHVSVTNPSKETPYPNGQFTPCLIIGNNENGELIQLDEVLYSKVYQGEILSIYSPINP